EFELRDVGAGDLGRGGIAAAAGIAARGAPPIADRLRRSGDRRGAAVNGKVAPQPDRLPNGRTAEHADRDEQAEAPEEPPAPALSPRHPPAPRRAARRCPSSFPPKS